jgi:hypothetical protein
MSNEEATQTRRACVLVKSNLPTPVLSLFVGSVGYSHFYRVFAISLRREREPSRRSNGTSNCAEEKDFQAIVWGFFFLVSERHEKS